MDRQKKYILNAVLLSVVSVVIRAVTVSFNAYVTRKIGTEAVGLFTLVMSVYTFAVTLAVSGVNLAAVRITSESLALCEAKQYSARKTRSVLRRDMAGCCIYSLFFGGVSGTLLYSLSGVIGRNVLCDIRTVSSLRVLSVALIPIAVSSALAGYFTGLRKIYKNAAVSITEQFIKITLTSAALVIIAPNGVEYACLSVVGGSAAAEALSMITSFVLYITDRIKTDGKISDEKTKTVSESIKSVSGIALPVAFGSYVRQGLTCAEHIAIPKGLRKFGADPASALSAYGILQGMALPLILFPSSVTSAFSSLLIPELSELSVLGYKNKIADTAERAVRFCLAFSIGAAAVFLTFGSGLGISVYGNADAGKYIVILASLVPIMYLDTTVDSILKGMGEQLYCMKVNILDATLSLIIVTLLVPRMGVIGYIVCIYSSECINAALSIGKTVSVTGLKFGISWFVRPAVTASLLCIILKTVTSRIYIGGTPAEIAVFCAAYAGILFLGGKLHL